MEKEKIYNMFSSEQEEIMSLAAILALGMGEEWCRNFFRISAEQQEGNTKKRYKWNIFRAALAKPLVITKGNLMIYMRDYAHLYNIREIDISHVPKDRIINLDHESTENY